MYNYEGLESLLVALGALIIVVLIIALAYLIFYLIGLAKLFKKAGKPGWAAIIPFYNKWVLVEMVELNWYWFLVAEASFIVGLFVDSGILSSLAWIASIIADINIYYNLTKKMDKEPVWTALLVLFGGILIPILGFGKDEWNAAAPVTPNGLCDNIGANKGAQSAQQPENPTESTDSSSQNDGK